MHRKPDGNSASTAPESEESDANAFARLFADAHRRCFSAELSAPLTESESHRLSVEIEESTGLEIGWKSLKNFSAYLVGRSTRAENPSIATLDTLARYVAGAPRTDQAERRRKERHYPYWYRYRDSVRGPAPMVAPLDGPKEIERVPDAGVGQSESARGDLGTSARGSSRRQMLLVAAIVAAIGVALALPLLSARRHRAERITDEFDDASAATLAARGWSVRATDSAHWAKRGEKPGHLTLFTLEGDNWPQPGRPPVIRNLLVRPLSSECFDADVRFSQFFPRQNWQQAGILLLEDTAFAGRSVRMSIGYNDFSGGFAQTREVLVQAITSLGTSATKPEEVVHQRLFEVTPASEALVRQNLESSALRIEKREGRLRLLYSAGPMTNGPFKEVGATDFDFRPAYVALFAIKGFATGSEEMPVYIDAFSEAERSCSR